MQPIRGPPHTPQRRPPLPPQSSSLSQVLAYAESLSGSDSSPRKWRDRCILEEASYDPVLDTPDAYANRLRRYVRAFSYDYLKLLSDVTETLEKIGCCAKNYDGLIASRKALYYSYRQFAESKQITKSVLFRSPPFVIEANEDIRRMATPPRSPKEIKDLFRGFKGKAARLSEHVLNGRWIIEEFVSVRIEEMTGGIHEEVEAASSGTSKSEEINDPPIPGIDEPEELDHQVIFLHLFVTPLT
jgi:hypothetical protein